MKLFLVVLLAVGAFGAPPRGVNWRIVGGSNANEGAYPYQISLKSFGAHKCGGSIIDNTTILTAAHCVWGSLTSDMIIVAGTNLVNFGGVEYEVSEIRTHESFDHITLDNDITLVKLATPITFSDKIQPVDTETEYLEGDVDCVITGWGDLSFPGNSPNNLQQLDLKTITTKACRDALQDDTVTENHICTYTKSGEGTCYGDSGGPLVANNKQIGIVSWGRPCGTGYPDVFTRVSSYADWIAKK